MLIAQLEPPSPALQGDQVYRTLQPCRALSRLPETEVVSGPWLSGAMQRLARAADVLVICQCVDVDFLPLLHARRRQGRLSVFEINDHFLALPPWNRAAAAYANPVVRSLAPQLARQADGLQLATSALQEIFGHLNPRRCLLPNGLWEMRPALPRGDAPLVLGWGGSLGHREDVRAVVPVIGRLLAANPTLRWLTVAPKAMHDVFAALPAERSTLLGAMTLSDYLTHMATLHIGLAPLDDSDFNRCRSDLKFLEYSQHQVAAVCSAVGPYNASVRHGINGLFYQSEAELQACVQRLIDQPQMRRRLAAAAADYVQQERLEAPWAQVRRDFYTNLGRLPGGRGPASLRDLLGAAPAHWHEPTYARLELTAAEAHTYRGLLAPEGSREALQAQAAGAHGAGSNYMPWLCLGLAEPDPRRALQALSEAARLAPQSAHVPYTMARRLIDLHEGSLAVGALRQTLRQAPDFAPAHDALAQIALQSGDAEAGQRHRMAAKRANPDWQAHTWGPGGGGGGLP